MQNFKAVSLLFAMQWLKTGKGDDITFFKHVLGISNNHIVTWLHFLFLIRHYMPQMSSGKYTEVSAL